MFAYIVPPSEAESAARAAGPHVHRVPTDGRVLFISSRPVRALAGYPVVQNEHPFILVSRALQSDTTRIEVNSVSVGGAQFAVIAGPCSVESEAQLREVAQVLARWDVRLMRGGAFKPRTSPYSFQGLGEEGLRMFRRVADEYGMAVVSELLDLSLLETVYPYVDVIQVGSRNMFNYQLLKALGRVNKPVLLKRGMYATVEEWLLAAEYILLHGNEAVILCERGIRSFDPYFRNVLDLNAVALIRELSHLPVVVDPSQGTGRSDIIPPLARAAQAVGAHGLMVEVHPRPEEALSDGFQSLTLEEFDAMMAQLNQPSIPLIRN